VEKTDIKSGKSKTKLSERNFQLQQNYLKVKIFSPSFRSYLNSDLKVRVRNRNYLKVKNFSLSFHRPYTCALALDFPWTAKKSNSIKIISSINTILTKFRKQKRAYPYSYSHSRVFKSN